MAGPDTIATDFESDAPQPAGPASTGDETAPAVPQTLPTPTVAFDGITVFDTAEIGQGFLPPDTSGEVGPNHYVQAVNVAFRVWDKSGTPLTPVISLGSLFSTIPGPCRSISRRRPGRHLRPIGRPVADKPAVRRRFYPTITWSPSRKPRSDRRILSLRFSNAAYQAHGLDKIECLVRRVLHDQSPVRQVRDRFLSGARASSPSTGRKCSPVTRRRGYVYFDSCPDNLNCKFAGSFTGRHRWFCSASQRLAELFALFTADEYTDPQGDGLRLFDFHADFATPATPHSTERTGSPLPAGPIRSAGFLCQPARLSVSPPISKRSPTA